VSKKTDDIYEVSYRIKHTGSHKKRSNGTVTGYAYASDGTKLYASAKTAQEWQRNINQKIRDYQRQRNNALPEDTTIRTICDIVISQKQHCAQKTISKYNHYARLLCNRFPKRDIRTITIDELKLLLSEFRENAADNSAWNFRQFIVMIWANAYDSELISRNIAKKSPTIKRKTKPALNITSQQFARAFDLADTPQLKAVLLLIRMGLRINEALAINADSLNGNCVMISEQLSRVGIGGKTVRALTNLKTDTSRRQIQLDEDSMRIVYFALDSARPVEIHSAISNKIETKLFVVNSPHGGIWREDHVRKEIKRIFAEAQIPSEVTIHDVRSLFVVDMIALGVDIKLVSQAVGHSDVSITQMHYNRVRTEALIPLWKLAEQSLVLK
jgi:integrase